MNVRHSVLALFTTMLAATVVAGCVPATTVHPVPEPRQITTAAAPQAIGPYSQAIVAGNLVFAAGQIGLDPDTGEMVAGGIEEETERVPRNLAAVLEAAGSSLDHVVKTTVFLTSLDDFPAMNEVYGRTFGARPPARSTVEVSRLPAGAVVEIEVIAVRR